MFRFTQLTPTLPRCHLKTTIKSAKFQTLKAFCFLFWLACERIFIKRHSIASRCVTELEKMPFAGASVHLSARTFSPTSPREGAVKGLKVTSSRRAQRNEFYEMHCHKNARCVPFLEDCRALCFNLGTTVFLSRSFRPSADSCTRTAYKSIHTHQSSSVLWT